MVQPRPRFLLKDQKPWDACSRLRCHQVQIFDGQLNAIAYGFKPKFDMRDTLPQQRDSNGSVCNRQNTSKHNLNVDNDVEVSMLMNELGFKRRLILIGVGINHSKNGRPVFHITCNKGLTRGIAYPSRAEVKLVTKRGGESGPLVEKPCRSVNEN